MTDTKIIYTLTDEAPALATYLLLPLVQAFTNAASIVVGDAVTFPWRGASSGISRKR